MDPDYIPGLEPLGEPSDTIRLVIGLGIYVLALVGLVVYLLWKLPRKMEEPEDGPNTDREQKHSQ